MLPILTPLLPLLVLHVPLLFLLMTGLMVASPFGLIGSQYRLKCTNALEFNSCHSQNVLVIETVLCLFQTASGHFLLAWVSNLASQVHLKNSSVKPSLIFTGAPDYQGFEKLTVLTLQIAVHWLSTCVLFNRLDGISLPRMNGIHVHDRPPLHISLIIYLGRCIKRCHFVSMSGNILNWKWRPDITIAVTGTWSVFVVRYADKARFWTSRVVHIGLSSLCHFWPVVQASWRCRSHVYLHRTTCPSTSLDLSLWMGFLCSVKRAWTSCRLSLLDDKGFDLYGIFILMKRRLWELSAVQQAWTWAILVKVRSSM